MSTRADRLASDARQMVVVRDADERGGQGAEGVRDGGPLRHRGHRHPDRHRRADAPSRATRPDDDPVVSRRSRWCSSVPTTATSMPTAASCMPRRALSGDVRPSQAEDEEHRGGQVGELMISVAVAAGCSRLRRPAVRACDGSAASRLNILSMRSVIMNPPTTLIVAAVTAMKPSTVLTRAVVAHRRPRASRPARCRRWRWWPTSAACAAAAGTLVMTWKPTKPASTKT